MEVISLIGIIATVIGNGLTAWQIWQQRCNNHANASRVEKMQIANDALRETLSIVLENNRQLHGHIRALIERQGER